MKLNEKKMGYFLIICIILSLVIVGGTYAYFMARAVDNSTIKGAASTTSLGLKVEKITSVDMGFGLVPMRNLQAPGAAAMGCYDDNGNAGCQMYKITVDVDNDAKLFVDGYISVTPKDDRLETRFSSIYLDNDGKFYTKYTRDDFVDDNLSMDSYYEDLGIKSGACDASLEAEINHINYANCLFLKNEQLGGEVGRSREFYVMIWVYDNGTAQDYLQGMQQAYRGEVIFTTAEGNEISATFD